MKFGVFTLFALFSSFDVFSEDCTTVDKKVNLKDFVFEVNSSGKLKASSEKNLTKDSVKLVAPIISNSIISASIELKNARGKTCKKINFEVDPTLLCRDVVSGAIEPWTYWTYQSGPESPPRYSIVSTRSIVEENISIDNSRICGFATFLGNMGITNSNIESKSPSRVTESKISANGFAFIDGSDIKGKFQIKDVSTTGTGQIYIKDVNVVGDPTITSHKALIHLERVQITGNPTISEETPIAFATSALPTVYMSDVSIVGSPQITGGSEGVDFHDVQIEGSPTIMGEMIFDHVRIENDGLYTATAVQNGAIKQSSVITGNTVKGNNNHFSGFYYVNKNIENSTINGSVIRNSGGEIANVANLNNLSKNFVSSTFSGVGYISGSVEGGSTIHGYAVSGNYSGINFCASCSAYNETTVSGAVYTEGNVNLDNSDVEGTTLRDGVYIQDIRGSSLQVSQTSGAPSIVSSTVVDSSVSGTSYVLRSQLYNNTSVTCNAFVQDKVLIGQIAGCGYPDTKESKLGDIVQNKIDKNIADSILKISEMNKRSFEIKVDAIQKYKFLRKK